MAEAYRCDACGELHGGVPQSTYEHDARGLKYQTKPRTGDLCPECSEKLKRWLETGCLSDER